MYSQIVNMVNACETCLTFSNDNRKDPLMPHSIPQNPWEKVGINLFQLYDKLYLLIVSSCLIVYNCMYLSKYPEVRHGIPEEELTGHDVQFIQVINFNCIAHEYDST